MDNINSNELMDFWKKGKTLNQALSVFTDLKIRNEYINFINSENSNLEQLPSDTNLSEILLKGFETLNKISTRSNNRNKLINKLKANLLTHILSESIIGVGYETPIKTTDTPQFISLHVWPQNIEMLDWDDSSFSDNGINFIKIKLFKNPLLKNVPNKTINQISNIKIESKRVGRPDSGKDLLAAYILLKQNNKLNYNETLKAHTDRIQEAIKIIRKSNDISGTNYKTICKYLGKQFREDKQSIN